MFFYRFVERCEWDRDYIISFFILQKKKLNLEKLGNRLGLFMFGYFDFYILIIYYQGRKGQILIQILILSVWWWLFGVLVEKVFGFNKKGGDDGLIFSSAV